MSQFYIARFRADPLIQGVPFELAKDEDLEAAAVIALTIRAGDEHAVDEPWEIRIAGPFPIGPERVVLIDPKAHLG